MIWKRLFFWSCLIIHFASLEMCPVVKADELSGRVKDLVDAHESSLGLIHEFHVEFEVWYKPLLGSNQPAQAFHTATWLWSKSGGLERLQTRDFAYNQSTDKIDRVLFRDVFQNGEETKTLVGWNPEAPIKLSPVDQKGVKAYIQPQISDRTMPGECSTMLLLMLRDFVDPKDQRKSLREFLSDAYSVRLRDSESLEPEEKGLYCLRVRLHPEDAKSERDYFDIFLDPQAGMMVRKMVNHRENYNWPGEEKVLWAEWVHEVTKFRDVGEGIFFPEESEWRVYREGRQEPTAINRVVAKKLNVNEKIPGDVFEFIFPENTMVRYPVVNGKKPVALWGADNKMVKMMNSRDDVIKASMELNDISQKDGPISTVHYVLIITNIFVIFFLAVWYFRARSKRKNA